MRDHALSGSEKHDRKEPMKNIKLLLILQLVLFANIVYAKTQETSGENTAAQDGGEYLEENNEEEAEASAQTLSPENRMTTRKTIKESQLILNEAVINFEQGEKRKSKLLFHEALNLLNSADITPDQFYALRKEMNNIYDRLDTEFKDLTAKNKPSDGKYSICMDTDNALVKKYMKLYTEGAPKENIRKALERSGRYKEMISGILREYNLPRELIYLPIVESLYTINDRSSAGALGLWQIMPARARALNLKVNYWIDERKDPEKSTRAAAQYLKELYTMFDDWHLALAAYNRGEYGLARDMNFSKAVNISDFSDRNAVPNETERYVPQFIVCTLIGDNYADYGFNVQFEEALKYDDISVDKVIDLEVVAKCVESDLGTIRMLNPSLRTWCTPPNYENFILHLPAGTKELFLKNLANVKDLNPSRGFVKYRVMKGDYLGRIAAKFQTSVKAIQEDNRIKNARTLRIGQVLMIRPGRKYLK